MLTLMVGESLRGWSVSAVVCGALVAAVACSGDPEPIEPTTTAPPATPTSSTTSTADGESPPDMPDAALEDTEAGAIAFVEHYIDVFNYTANTGDAEPLRALSHPDCEGCETYAASFEEKYEAGGYNEGFEWRLSEPMSSNRLVEAYVVVSQYQVADDGQSAERTAAGSEHAIGFELEPGDQPLVLDLYRISQ